MYNPLELFKFRSKSIFNIWESANEVITSNFGAEHTQSVLINDMAFFLIKHHVYLFDNLRSLKHSDLPFLNETSLSFFFLIVEQSILQQEQIIFFLFYIFLGIFFILIFFNLFINLEKFYYNYTNENHLTFTEFVSLVKILGQQLCMNTTEILTHKTLFNSNVEIFELLKFAQGMNTLNSKHCNLSLFSTSDIFHYVYFLFFNVPLQLFSSFNFTNYSLNIIEDSQYPDKNIFDFIAFSLYFKHTEFWHFFESLPYEYSKWSTTPLAYYMLYTYPLDKRDVNESLIPTKNEYDFFSFLQLFQEEFIEILQELVFTGYGKNEPLIYMFDSLFILFSTLKLFPVSEISDFNLNKFFSETESIKTQELIELFSNPNICRFLGTLQLDRPIKSGYSDKIWYSIFNGSDLSTFTVMLNFLNDLQYVLNSCINYNIKNSFLLNSNIYFNQKLSDKCLTPCVQKEIKLNDYLSSFPKLIYDQKGVNDIFNIYQYNNNMILFYQQFIEPIFNFFLYNDFTVIAEILMVNLNDNYLLLLFYLLIILVYIVSFFADEFFYIINWGGDSFFFNYLDSINTSSIFSNKDSFFSEKVSEYFLQFFFYEWFFFFFYSAEKIYYKVSDVYTATDLYNYYILNYLYNFFFFELFEWKENDANAQNCFFELFQDNDVKELLIFETIKTTPSLHILSFNFNIVVDFWKNDLKTFIHFLDINLMISDFFFFVFQSFYGNFYLFFIPLMRYFFFYVDAVYDFFTDIFLAEIFSQKGFLDFNSNIMESYDYTFFFFFFNFSVLFILFFLLIFFFFYVIQTFFRLKSTKFQIMISSLFNILTKIILDILTHVLGKKYFLFLLILLFLFIVCYNLFGLIPYSFAVTSYFSVTFFFSFIFFFCLFFIGILLHGILVLNLFIPPGTPFLILPLLFIIEIISYFARVFSLAIRLFANITAGHILLYIFSWFVSLLFDLMLVSVVGFIVISVLWVLEGFISILQAYVFVVLLTLYLNEILYLEH